MTKEVLPLDTPILLIIIYLLNNNIEFNSINSLHTIKNYFNTLEVDSRYTKEKIQIAKKIVPLLPVEYLTTFNKSIFITERIIKTLELAEFLQLSDVDNLTALDLEPKERIQKIVSTVQEEIQSSKLENLGIVLDLILNMEKYKKLLSTFSNIKSKNNSDKGNIMNLVDILMEGSNEKDKEKVKEMSKMFDLLKLLDGPKTIEEPNEG